jgi:hypothetical protein
MASYDFGIEILVRQKSEAHQRLVGDTRRADSSFA